MPVGTVRSRLSQVKLKLADAILETAETAHGEATAVAAARERYITESVEEFGRTGSHAAFLAPMADDVEILKAASGESFRGRDMLALGMAMDAADGVGFLPTQVICGPGMTILEARFVNPDYDPFHCPPATAQIHFHRGDETYRMVWHYAQREA